MESASCGIMPNEKWLVAVVRRIAAAKRLMFQSLKQRNNGVGKSTLMEAHRKCHVYAL